MIIVIYLFEIHEYSKMLTFWENSQKPILFLAQLEAENRFLGIFSKTNHLRVYVASWLIYKCGHCGYFAGSKSG